MILSATASFGLVALGVDPHPLSRPAPSLSGAGIVGSVIFAPLAETALLAGLLQLLLIASKNPPFVAAASALLWGGFHASLGPLAFFGAAWGFFVFSCAYLAWRRISFSKAFGAALIPHMLGNAMSFSLLLLA